MQRRAFLLGTGAALLPFSAAAAPLADDITALTNQARRNAGLPPLAPSPALATLSASYAKTLLRTGQLTHTAGGTTLTSRLNSIGYAYRAAAENIADQSRSDPANLANLFLESWLASKGHRRNILNPALHQIGTGTATSKRITYAVQVFATPQ